MPGETHEYNAKFNVGITAQIEARVIANFAWQHLKAATLFRDRVIAIEAANKGAAFGPFFEDLRSYGSACIISAAASLEALINELFISPNLKLRPMFHDFEVEFWSPKGIERRPTLDKYQLALEMSGAPLFDENAEPYLAASALIGLRNTLIHYKPTWDPDRPRKVALIEALKGSYAQSPFPDSGADFVTMKSMSAACSKWAEGSVLAFVKEFDTRTNLDSNKMSSFYGLG